MIKYLNIFFKKLFRGATSPVITLKPYANVELPSGKVTLLQEEKVIVEQSNQSTVSFNGHPYKRVSNRRRFKKKK